MNIMEVRTILVNVTIVLALVLVVAAVAATPTLRMLVWGDVVRPSMGLVATCLRWLWNALRP